MQKYYTLEVLNLFAEDGYWSPQFGDFDLSVVKKEEEDIKEYLAEHNIDRAKTRMEYLKTELAHERYWDGWSVQGMKEEKEWLENQLIKLDTQK